MSMDDISQMHVWYNLSRLNWTGVQDWSKLGENVTFEEYVRVVSQSRGDRYWFGRSTAVPLIIAYVVIIAFGLFANSLICYIVLRRRQLRTVRNMFIVNLAVSDILMCVFCMPTTLVKLLLKNWPLGDALCRLVPWLQAVNVCASTLTITAIAIDRYQVIVYPSNIREVTKRRAAVGCVAIIWIISIVMGLPFPILSHVKTMMFIHFVNYEMCLEDWPSKASKIVYTVFVMVLQFLVPIAVLITIHWQICNFLKCRIIKNPTTATEMNRAMKEAKRHRKNSTLLMAIAIMFALCWFPLTLLNMLADLNYKILRNFLLGFAVAHLVAMTSACLNPIMYGWFNSNFRREFTHVVCFWRDFRQDSERKHLVQAEGKHHHQHHRHQERRNVAIVYKKEMRYKAIQTEVQPQLQHARKDNRHRSLPTNVLTLNSSQEQR